MGADLIIKGGTVVDGTGAPAQRADVMIKDGRIISIDAPSPHTDAGETIDADGLVVAPGFIDIHTHLDAQVFWDPACSQSLFHGITTAIGGNCGFSIAPLPSVDDGYVMRMLSAVEEIPLETLEQGVSWDWRSTGEYLDRVEAAHPVVNMGFLVGHSALRRMVMGDEAVGGTPTTQQLEQMGALLRRSLQEGGLGFSSSWNVVHVDGEGMPVPSRSAGADELISLCRVVREIEGTQVEFIPPISADRAFDSERTALLTNMSLAAQRTVNWNLFQPRDDEACQSQLRASELAAQAGASVVALTYPAVMKARRSFYNSSVFADLTNAPGKLSIRDRVKLLSDPAFRRRLAEFAQAPLPNGSIGVELSKLWGLPPRVGDVVEIGDLILLDSASRDLRRYELRRLSDIGAEVGRDPFDLMCDLAIADELRTGFMMPLRGTDMASWKIRDESWTNPNVVLGASDAGAHVQSLSTFDWVPAFLELNRRRQVISLEQAIHRVTDVQATLYGLKGRGRIAKGWAADLVLFDPDTIAPEPARWVQDLPGSAGRLMGKAAGIERVIVNGVEVVRTGELTGHRPGTVLRSGKDTTTVGLLSNRL